MIIHSTMATSLLRVAYGLGELSTTKSKYRHVFLFVPNFHTPPDMDAHVLVAPNSTWLPESMVDHLKGSSLKLFTPSKWARGILQTYGLDAAVFPHGCSVPLSGRLARDPSDGAIRVLHASSSVFGRKGTLELIEAWRRLDREHRLPDNAFLGLRALNTDVFEHLMSLELPPRAGLVPGVANVDVVLALDHYSLVCQPSRGEAFGMLPLEALACGVPVVATTCTGHSEYLQDVVDGLIPVPTGEMAPLDEGPGAEGMAPSLDPKDIADALEKAFERFAKGTWRVDAERWRVEWSWERLTRQWLKDTGAEVRDD